VKNHRFGVVQNCFRDGNINNSECSILGEFTGHGHALNIQETPFILACSNIDYLRFGNVKFNDKSLTLCNQEEAQLAHAVYTNKTISPDQERSAYSDI
jgi:hypothetical protein